MLHHTGRVADVGRHNQDICVMRLPASGLADLIDGGALGPIEHVDHGGLLAGLTGSDCSMLNERWLKP